MNLTNLDSNSSNLNLPNPSLAAFDISQTPPSTNTTPANDSPILRSLGEKILNQTESLSLSLAASNEINPSRIKNFEHLTHELQSIFTKTSQLMQKSYNDDSSSIRQEIEELESEVNSLESLLAKSLSGKELDQLQDITKDFHNILKSAESYLAFKERFLAVDEDLSGSLELITGSLYCDLHGWSSSAAHGAAESLDHMRTLIKMTIPILEQKGTFTPEILAQLASSIRSGSIVCIDWLHGLTAKYTHVLSVAKEQWTLAEKAFETSSSMEDFTKMQLYGKQLKNMQEVFEQLQKLTDPAIFTWMASRLNKQMQKDPVNDEYAMKKIMRDDLQFMQKELAEAAKLAESHAGKLDKVLKDSRIDEKLAKAEEVIAKKDLKPFINNVHEDYAKERSLERYITAKCRLSGIPKGYEEELAFCYNEEQRFVQQQGYAIDFDELVQAEMMKLGQPKPGMFSRLWQALPDPGNWSDTTKRLVHTSLIGLQLADQVVKALPRSNPVIKETPTLPKEAQELLADERSLIGNLLDVKFEVFKKDPSKIDHFSKKNPEVGNFFKALIERYPRAPSSQDRRVLMDRYEVYRTGILLNSGSKKSLNWVVETTHIPVKAKPINSSPQLLAATTSKTTETALPKMETTLSTAQNIENIREASREIAVLDRQLQQCSRMEFLKPSLPVTPKALLELREELAILKHSLADSMENKPVEQSAEWNLAVQQQCHYIRDLEKRIGVAMSAYEEARAMNNYYNYNSLDVLGNKHKNLVKQAHITEALGVERRDISSDLLSPVNNSIKLGFKNDSFNSMVLSNGNVSSVSNSSFNASELDDNTLLNRIKNGAIVFFSHVNSVTQLTIKESQKLLNKGWKDFFNVTHAGIVVDSSDDHMEVSEIPGFGKKLSRNIYNLKDIPVGDNLIFIHGVHGNLINRVVELAKVWTQNLNDNPENQYNLKDIVLHPLQMFSGQKMSLESKNRLAEAFIDTFIFGQQPLDSKENYAVNRKFYCSEFVVEVFQVAWLEKHASLPLDIKEIKDQLSQPNIDSSTRKKIAKEILEHWNANGVWDQLATTELIGSPAMLSSPSELISNAQKNGRIITIEGTAKRNLDNYAEHAEYSLTRALDRYLSGEEMSADHPDVIVGLEFLEKRVKLSDQTISCLNQKNEDIPGCVAESMTWYEKFGTYLITRELKRVLNQLVKEEVFHKIAKETLNEINQPVPNFSDIKEKSINELLPTKNMDLTSLENYIVNYFLENASPETATKYVLLAVLSDYSNDSILQQLKDIINEKNFSLDRLHQALCSKNMLPNEVMCDKSSKLYVRIAESLLKKIIKDKSLENLGKQSLQTTLREVIRNLQGTQELDEVFLPIVNTMGYSQDTLNCLVKDYANENNIDVKSCLEATLTISEKLGIVMSSYRSNEALDNFVDSPLAKMLISKEIVNEELVNQLWLDMTNKPEEFFLNLFFPLNVDSYTQKITNLFYRRQIGNLSPNDRKHQIFKYIPLGLHFKNPSDKVRDFITELSKRPNRVILEKFPFTKALTPLISLYQMDTAKMDMESLLKIYEDLKQFV